MGDVVLGVDFQSRRELSELEAASEAYLTTPNDLNFDRLLNCIKRMNRKDSA